MCLLARYVVLLAFVWVMKVDLLDNPACLEMIGFEKLDIEDQDSRRVAKSSFAVCAWS